MKNNLFLLLLLISQLSFSQAKDKLMAGKINTLQVAPDGVEVINMTTKKTTKSNALGKFSLYAKTGDVIVFSSPSFEYAKKTITSSEFSAGTFAVSMIPKVTELEEVVVQKDEKLVHSELFDSAKQYTVAERRLQTGARTARLNQGLEISNDAILNAISGKSKRLRKELAIEKKESYMEQIEDTYPDHYYTKSLGIEKDYVAGFKYFIVEDAAFIKTLEARNKVSMDATILELAQEYKELLANEK